MTVQIWLPATGHTVFTYREHTHEVLSVVWSPNGKFIASGGADQTVQIWNAETGSTLLTYPMQYTTVVTLAWSLDSTHIASAGLDQVNALVGQVVQVWQAA